MNLFHLRSCTGAFEKEVLGWHSHFSSTWSLFCQISWWVHRLFSLKCEHRCWGWGCKTLSYSLFFPLGDSFDKMILQVLSRNGPEVHLWSSKCELSSSIVKKSWYFSLRSEYSCWGWGCKTDNPLSADSLSFAHVDSFNKIILQALLRNATEVRLWSSK